MIIEYDNSSHVAIDKWDAFKCFVVYVLCMTTVLKFSKLLCNVFRFLNESQSNHRVRQGLLLATGQIKIRSFISWNVSNSFHIFVDFSLSYSAMYCIWKLF